MDNNLISNKELIEMGYRPHTANDIRASLACGGEAGGKRPGKDVGAAACRDVE